MIALTCSHCDKHLKVKDELAGKKVRCPQCKQILEIPHRFSEDATVPPSANHQEEGATMAPSRSPPSDEEPVRQSAETMTHVSDEEPAEDLAAATNYKVAGEIARGGMGAIKRAVDKDICREVAVKFLLNNADDRQKARFVEETQITGQLEHPNIVPIHQLGVHRDGRAFFSMKMVKGRSLEGKTALEARQRLLEIHRKRIDTAWPGQGNMLKSKEGRYSLRLLKVTDLTPLRGMPFTALDLLGNEQIRDLAPLKGMRLTWLRIGGSPVRDLSPLKGMPLTNLALDVCIHVRDLEPLKGMPLKSLWINGTGVTDLTPLRGMELEEIRLTPKNITQGLDILRDMESLKTIGIGRGQFSWPAAEFWDRYEKGEFKK